MHHSICDTRLIWLKVAGGLEPTPATTEHVNMSTCSPIIIIISSSSSSSSSIIVVVAAVDVDVMMKR